MTAELVLLLGLFAFILLGVFKGPHQSFTEAGPKLGARMERQISTGADFIDGRTGTAPPHWQTPPGEPLQ